MVGEKRSLQESHPELAAEALFDASTVTAGSNRVLPWRGACGHEWEANVYERSHGTGCPYCSNRKVLRGFNDLATTHPEIAKEALFDPKEFTYGSGAKLDWRCPDGHVYSAKPNSRTSGAGRGCPVCANKRVLAGQNDLATTHPEIASQMSGDATTVTAGSHERVWWTGSCGHEWEALIRERVAGTNCPFCAGKKVLSGFNDLATIDPELASEALFDPRSVTANSAKKLPWRCSLGHEWESTVANRKGNKSGCPVCAGKRVVVGFNDLATTHPRIAAEATFDATTIVANHASRKLWRCDLGHEWFATPNTRTSLDSGCPVCSNKRVLDGFNDLATTHPQLALEAMFDPTTVTAHSGKKLRWRCSKGHEWQAQIASRSYGRGCPSCSQSGFDPGKDAWLYLLQHEGWDMLQVGISNDIQVRIATHKRNGWEPLDVLGPMPGDVARGWENSILSYLRAIGTSLSASTATENQASTNATNRGEAWMRSDFSTYSLVALRKLVADWEESNG
jgi:hypothetical protein